MKVLSESIKDGKNKLCPQCKSRVYCSNFFLEKGKYKGREFWCSKCNSKYSYIRFRTEFLIRGANYKLPSYEIIAEYYQPGAIYRTNNKFSILPCDRSLTYTTYEYSKIIVVTKKLDFPIDKETLEDKISLYITFN